jgi:hypothetical protein
MIFLSLNNQKINIIILHIFNKPIKKFNYIYKI